MSSSWLLRRCARPWTTATHQSIHVATPLSPLAFYTSRSRWSVQTLPLMSLELRHASSAHEKSALLVRSIPFKRFYSAGRHKTPWRNDSRDWTAALKTSGLVLLGAGALVASTSLAFGLLIAGAAGFGAYAVYHKLLRLYRSRAPSSSASDPFSSVSSEIDALHDTFFRRSRQRRKAETVADSPLSAMVQGLPLVVRGAVKMLLSVVGSAVQSSFERAEELQRQTTELLQANKRVREQMGDDVSVGEPEQWMESTVNGVGRIDAVFPVNAAYRSARVTMKASIGAGGDLKMTQLTYHNRQTGDSIDLLRDPSAGRRPKTVIDAEYVDLDNDDRSFRR
ncbi:unnamed protein product [Hyaloperonospora brassicae]|uniref:Uncharacterized protein n=1 Tax=Hyaloperonospora brassicae TaxID=162125 RepID=A0AAV0UPP1_HYABA|nr:unnamed protein product [Hyaloperonospora brassicae]